MSHDKSKCHSELEASFARCTTSQTHNACRHLDALTAPTLSSRWGEEKCRSRSNFYCQNFFFFFFTESVTFVDCTLSKQSNTLSSQLRGISKNIPIRVLSVRSQCGTKRFTTAEPQLLINQQVVVATKATWHGTACSLALVIVTTAKLQKLLLSFLSDWSLLADDSSRRHISC